MMGMIDDKAPTTVQHTHQSTKRNVDSSKFQNHDIKRHINANLQKLQHRKPIRVKKEVFIYSKTGDKMLNALNLKYDRNAIFCVHATRNK